MFTIIVLTVMNNNFIPKTYYKASDFDIKTIYSSTDFDNDKIDDYSDFKVTHTIRDVLSKNVYEYRSNNVMSICNIEKDTDISNLQAYRATYSLCITNRCVSSIDMLESLIRELNKIFLSKNNTFKYLGNNVTLRNGISYTNLKDSNIEDKKTINDVISYLQIEDILNVIKKLNYSGNNKDLNKLLNDIKDYDMDNIVLDCCLPLVNLFRPLFAIDYVKGAVVCESPNIEDDAKLLKDYYLSL